MDPVLDALDELLLALRRVEERFAMIRDRERFIRAERAAGRKYQDVLDEEPRPLIVEMLTATSLDLQEAGSHFRRAQARALHDEGVTMDRIAEQFGVTRQRISALLRADAS